MAVKMKLNHRQWREGIWFVYVLLINILQETE